MLVIPVGGYEWLWVYWDWKPILNHQHPSRALKYGRCWDIVRYSCLSYDFLIGLNLGELNIIYHEIEPHLNYDNSYLESSFMIHPDWYWLMEMHGVISLISALHWGRFNKGWLTSWLVESCVTSMDMPPLTEIHKLYINSDRHRYTKQSFWFSGFSPGWICEFTGAYSTKKTANNREILHVNWWSLGQLPAVIGWQKF